MNLKKIILIGGVALSSATVGVLIPTMMMGKSSSESADGEHIKGHGSKEEKGTKDAHAANADSHAPKKDDSHAAKPDAHAAKPDAHGGGHGGKDDAPKPKKEGPVYLHFERLVVNLNDPNLVRFLSLDIAIQTDAKHEDEVAALMKEKHAVLMTFLTSHIADLTVDEVRGKAGISKLRRDIQDNFNMHLFKDGHERIQDVFFDEIHVD